MAIDERERHQLRERLDEVLGAEEALIRADMLANHRQLIFAIIASQFTAVSLAFVATSL